MNKTVVIILLCSLYVVPEAFGMNREALIRSLGKFEDTESGESESGSVDKGTIIFWDLMSSSDSNDEEQSSEDDVCFRCGHTIQSLPEAYRVMRHCNPKSALCNTCFYATPIVVANPYLLSSESNDEELMCSEGEMSSDIVVFELLTHEELEEFTDDKPLFNHKKGNAKAHAMSSHYHAKQSMIHELKKLRRLDAARK